MNAIWTFVTEFPTFFNKSCTYITFKSAFKHRQLGYGCIYIVCIQGIPRYKLEVSLSKFFAIMIKRVLNQM